VTLLAKESKNPDVKCNVSTCTHWYSDNRCGAADIDILNEEVGKMSETKEQTMCKTFSEKRGLANMMGSSDNVNWVGFAEELVGVGRQLNPTVTCIVDTCKYYEDGNLCNADTIEVSGKNASECQATDCDTFEFNDKPSKNAASQQKRERGESFKGR
jgi:hypothetical protein